MLTIIRISSFIYCIKIHYPRCMKRQKSLFLYSNLVCEFGAYKCKMYGPITKSSFAIPVGVLYLDVPQVRPKVWIVFILLLSKMHLLSVIIYKWCPTFTRRTIKKGNE